MTENIAGKVVAITGASSGLGEATARHLAAEGAKVFLGARREDNLKNIVAELGDDAAYQVVDVTSREQVQSFVDAAVRRFGRLDVMVNNAGLMPLSPLDALKIDEWDRIIDVNVKGVLYGIGAALPIMQSQDAGHIVNLSSVAGHKVLPNSAVYSGAKFAVRAITEGLRGEIGPDIRATIISPGAVESELISTITHEDSAAGAEQLYQLAIDADAVARAIAYAIAQPREVDVNEIVLRPTAQAV